MLEVAIGIFGLTLDAARGLSLYGYRLHHQAHARRYREEHARDLTLAWMTARMHHSPIPFRRLQRLIAGKGHEADQADEAIRERVMAEFEAAYQEELAAEAAAAKGGADGG